MSFDFDPGRYGAYIWPAYAASLAAFLWMVGDSLAKARRWRREAEQKEAAREEPAP